MTGRLSYNNAAPCNRRADDWGPRSTTITDTSTTTGAAAAADPAAGPLGEDAHATGQPGSLWNGCLLFRVFAALVRVYFHV